MFADGKIDQSTTPKAAYWFHSEFSKFTMPVFYNNFRQLRQLHGLECTYILLVSIFVQQLLYFHIFFIVKTSENSLSSALSCSEDLANSSSTRSLVVSRKRLHDDQESDLTNEEIEDLDCKFIHQNQPVLMAVYKDNSLAEIVSICVTLPSDVTDTRFTLDGTGPATTLATVTYTWPQVMFEIEGLFASAIKKKLCYTKN
jgi:hypothetical protein